MPLCGLVCFRMFRHFSCACSLQNFPLYVCRAPSVLLSFVTWFVLCCTVHLDSAELCNKLSMAPAAAELAVSTSSVDPDPPLIAELLTRGHVRSLVHPINLNFAFLLSCFSTVLLSTYDFRSLGMQHQSTPSNKRNKARSTGIRTTSNSYKSKYKGHMKDNCNNSSFLGFYKVRLHRNQSMLSTIMHHSDEWFMGQGENIASPPKVTTVPRTTVTEHTDCCSRQGGHRANGAQPSATPCNAEWLELLEGDLKREGEHQRGMC
jgi:hypothetical protein